MENDGTMRIIRKATPKEIIGEMPSVTEETWLYNISGTATDFEIVESENKGDSTRLLGNFAVVIISTGEVCVSGQCFLPAGIGELVASRMRSKVNDPENDTPTKIPATFDFQVGIRPATRKDPVKPYEYVVRAFGESAKLEDNPLMKRLLAAPKTVKALPPATK